MRSLESEPDFQAALRLFPPECQLSSAVFQEIDRGFSSSRVYMFHSYERKWIGKWWPAEQIEPARWQQICQLLHHCHKSGLRIVAPAVANRKGQFLTPFRSGWFHIEPCLAGIELRQAPSRPQLSQLMESLADLHHQLSQLTPTATTGAIQMPGLVKIEQYRPVFQKSTTLQTRCNLLQQQTQTGFRERIAAQVFATGDFTLLDQLQRLIQVADLWEPVLWQELPQKLQTELPAQWVWRDLHRGNILWQTGQLTGFIDPAGMAFDSVLCDLTRLLASYWGNVSEEWLNSLAIYEVIHPLSIHEKRALILFDLSNLYLSSWKCLQKLLEHSAAAGNDTGHEDHRQQRLIERLQTYLLRLENYGLFRREMEALTLD